MVYLMVFNRRNASESELASLLWMQIPQIFLCYIETPLSHVIRKTTYRFTRGYFLMLKPKDQIFLESKIIKKKYIFKYIDGFHSRLFKTDSVVFILPVLPIEEEEEN